MCQNCKESADHMNAKFESMDVAELVTMLGIVRGTQDASLPERLAAVLEFASRFEDPIEIVGLSHHLGVHYLAEKDRADKLQATLEMLSDQKVTKLDEKVAGMIANREREIAGLKSSQAMLLTAFNIVSSQSGFEVPKLDSSNPLAVRQLLGTLADQLDAKRSRLEEMMRELTHRHDLNKERPKAYPI